MPWDGEGGGCLVPKPHVSLDTGARQGWLRGPVAQSYAQKCHALGGQCPGVAILNFITILSLNLYFVSEVRWHNGRQRCRGLGVSVHRGPASCCLRGCLTDCCPPSTLRLPLPSAFCPSWCSTRPWPLLPWAHSATAHLEAD